MSSSVIVLPLRSDQLERHSSAPGVRLTRRGRAAVFLAALTVALGAGLMFGSSVTATDATGEAPATQAVMVQPGETLWDIASRIHPGGDIRDTIEEILELNSLSSPAGLQMGREIAVPVYE